VARFDRTIPPGGEGKITLEVRTQGYEGDVRKHARVYTNDPKQPQLTIGLEGKVWTPILMNPRYVRLNGVMGDDIENTVHLRADKKDPLMVKLASNSIPDKISVELKEVEKGRAYDLKLKNKIDKETNYRGQITLTTNYPEKPKIEVNVAGFVTAPISVNPVMLNFRRMSEEEIKNLKGDGNLKRPVTIFMRKGNDLEIKKVEVEKSLYRVDAKEIIKGRSVQVMVKPILGNLVKGNNLDRLKIYTNQKSREVVEVPIRFEVY
jgi:hypothetical protein